VPYILQSSLGIIVEMSDKMKNRMLQDTAFRALKKAVRKVVEEHKRDGRKLAVWRDGKVMLISPYKIK